MKLGWSHNLVPCCLDSAFELHPVHCGLTTIPPFRLVKSKFYIRLLFYPSRQVRWAPRNPDVNPPGTILPPFPFPWEYVNLDDILVDLKLPPTMLEVPVPKYYLEDRAEEIKNRNKVSDCFLHSSPAHL